MNEGQTQTEAPKSRPQYLMIDDSIERYDDVVDALQRLVENLKGGDSCHGDTPDSCDPSFMDVLNGSTDKILAQNDRLSKLIAELKVMLF